MIVKKQFTNFWVVLSIFTVVIFAFFFLVVNLWETLAHFLGLFEINLAEDSPKVSEPGKFLDAISNSLALLIGAPVALAGSAVAIILAQRALAVSERQEYNENSSIVNKEFDKLLDEYWTLSKSLRNLINKSKKLKAQASLSAYAKSNEEFLAAEGCVDAVNKFIEAKQEFINSLLQFIRNPTLKVYFETKGEDLYVNNIQNIIFDREHHNQVESSLEIKRFSDLCYQVEDFDDTVSDIAAKIIEFYSIPASPLEPDEDGTLWGTPLEVEISKSSPDDILFIGKLLSTYKIELLFLELFQGDEVMINKVFPVNLGAGLLFQLHDAFMLSKSELENLFRITYEDLFDENEKISSLISKKFSTLDVSTYIPESFSEQLDFLKKYHLLGLENSKFENLAEDFATAVMYKEIDGSWRESKDF